MSVKMLADALQAGKKSVPPGFIDAGTEVVTQTKVEEPYELAAITLDELAAMAEDAEAMHKYYKPLVTGDGKLANWEEALQPMTVQGS